MSTAILRTIDGHFLFARPTGERPVEGVGPDGEDIHGVEYDLDDSVALRRYRMVIWDTHATCDCPQYLALDDCRHVEAAALAGSGGFAESYTPRMAMAKGGDL
ncbi:MAG: hypothetical protein U0790_00255 [Isosphaeraceae bacterium]